MNQKTNNLFTFNQVILNTAGNSYLANAGKLISHVMAQETFKSLLKSKQKGNINPDSFFVYEMQGDNFILRASQRTTERAKFYYNNGDNTNRFIIHFGTSFIN